MKAACYNFYFFIFITSLFHKKPRELLLIPEGKKVIEQFFSNFPSMFPNIFVSKNTTTKIGHRSCLNDMMGQTYPICVCTGTNHARHSITLRYILRYLKARAFKAKLEKKSDE